MVVRYYTIWYSKRMVRSGNSQVLNLGIMQSTSSRTLDYFLKIALKYNDLSTYSY